MLFWSMLSVRMSVTRDGAEKAERRDKQVTNSTAPELGSPDPSKAVPAAASGHAAAPCTDVLWCHPGRARPRVDDTHSPCLGSDSNCPWLTEHKAQAAGPAESSGRHLEHGLSQGTKRRRAERGPNSKVVHGVLFPPGACILPWCQPAGGRGPRVPASH